jgi:hypothetical protein
MGIYKKWLEMAYNKDGGTDKQLWAKYLPLEQAAYEELLSTKTNSVEGTVSELAVRFNMPVEYICGFIDGVNDCLNGSIEVKALNEDTLITISFEFEKLYQQMVAYKAEHLYNLPQWNNIYTPEQKKEMYTEQKRSTTFVRTDSKIGRNDPCSCGSGKKYKKCCGAV